MKQLQDIQLATGAIFEEENQIPVSFGNDLEAWEAAKSGVALSDRSHCTLLEIADDDRLQFIHNQSTNNIKSLKPGQSCDTVFVNSTARTIDLATIYATDNSLLSLNSPHQSEQLLPWLDKYLFPMDRVKLKDISAEFAIFTLIGAESNALLEKVGIAEIISQPENSHQVVTLAETEIRIAVGCSLALPGYTLFIPRNQGVKIWEKLTANQAIPLGDRVWEKLRITQGRPMPGIELTEDYNPLEAGLWQTISFDKGCYIGQETIARLNTYQGVKQRLWGVKLDGKVEPGTKVTVGESKVGVLTSYAETPTGNFGLAYVRTKAGGAGLKVNVGEVAGELVAVPFLKHEYYQ